MQLRICLPVPRARLRRAQFGGRRKPAPLHLLSSFSIKVALPFNASGWTGLCQRGLLLVADPGWSPHGAINEPREALRMMRCCRAQRG